MRTNVTTIRLGPRQCWHAVERRDSRWDGAFVYAVRSTGIYCRPSCPARRARRGQVVFFPLPEAAEKEGFRPCRRCQPRDAERGPLARLVQRACRYIEQHLEGPVRLREVAEHVGVGPHHFQRVFHRAMGITPRQYADALRLNRLKRHLREGGDVTTALYEAGYGSSSRLYEQSNAQLGMTPATYRRGGRGMHIGYTLAECPLGRILVGATHRGISAVYLGDAEKPLEAALRAEYPNAEIYRDAHGLSQWVRAILRHLEGRQPQLDLPLDVQATAFQRRVWEALRKIPYGATRSYSQVAKSLGRPRAVRAVARACATNPVSIVVPCHRVVREDGNLAGYRWGLDRKRTLLEREQAVAAKR